MKLIGALCMGGLFMATAADAELTIKDFVSAKASGGDLWRYVQMYLAGAGGALTIICFMRNYMGLCCENRSSRI